MRPTFVLAASLLVATPLAGQEKPELVIYTYESFVSEWGPGPQIAANFEKICGCTVRFVGAGDGAALIGRLKLEGARSPADIILGLDTNLIAEAKAAGLVAPHGIAEPALDLPIAWEDDTFLPYDWSYFAFVYDKAEMPDPPVELRGADRVRRQHRHPRPAELDPGARPADVGQGRLRRPGAGDLGGARAAHRHRRAGLVGGLRPVPRRRGRHGARLHHLARLPPDRRGRRRQGRGDLRRGPLHAGRGGGDHRGVRPARPRPRLPALHADRRLPGGDPDDELDVSRAPARGRAARRLRRRSRCPRSRCSSPPRRRRRSANRRWRNGWRRSAGKRPGPPRRRARARRSSRR